MEFLHPEWLWIGGGATCLAAALVVASCRELRRNPWSYLLVFSAAAALTFVLASPVKATRVACTQDPCARCEETS